MRIKETIELDKRSYFRIGDQRKNKLLLNLNVETRKTNIYLSMVMLNVPGFKVSCYQRCTFSNASLNL